MPGLDTAIAIIVIACSLPIAFALACFVWAMMWMGLIELSELINKIFNKNT